MSNRKRKVATDEPQTFGKAVDISHHPKRILNYDNYSKRITRKVNKLGLSRKYIPCIIRKFAKFERETVNDAVYFKIKEESGNSERSKSLRYLFEALEFLYIRPTNGHPYYYLKDEEIISYTERLLKEIVEKQKTKVLNKDEEETYISDLVSAITHISDSFKVESIVPTITQNYEKEILESGYDVMEEYLLAGFAEKNILESEFTQKVIEKLSKETVTDLSNEQVEAKVLNLLKDWERKSKIFRFEKEGKNVFCRV